eukprot:m.1130719 g.1130719  ORF g.1130719 m.1130719 type:complete len:54 (+) comp24423_c2_seq1:226-387(+)
MPYSVGNSTPLEFCAHVFQEFSSTSTLLKDRKLLVFALVQRGLSAVVRIAKPN